MGIEDVFYETFGILPDKSENAYFCGNYNTYPKITATDLIKLICVANNVYGYLRIEGTFIDFDTFKKYILKEMVTQYKYLTENWRVYYRRQVRAVFNIRED